MAYKTTKVMGDLSYLTQKAISVVIDRTSRYGVMSTSIASQMTCNRI